MSGNSIEPDSNGDWRDRLIDSALGELVGRESPPELTERILAAQAASADELAALSSTGVPAMSAETASRQTGFRTWALAASLLLNLGLGTWLLTDREDRTPPVAVLVDQSSNATSEIAQQEEHLRDKLAELSQIREQLRQNDSGEMPATASSSPAESHLHFSQTIAVPEEVTPASARPEVPNDSVPPPTSLDLLKSASSSAGGGQSQQGSSEFGADMGLQDREGYFAGGGQGRGLTRLYAAHDERKQANLAVYPDGLSRSNSTTWGDTTSRFRRWPNGARPADELWTGDPAGRGLGPGASGDQYSRIVENPFKLALGEQAISTFSIDVDTASYANVRQMLQNNVYPPADAVRLEEFVNYFTYSAKYSDFVSDLPTDPAIIDKTEDQLYVEQAPFAAQVEVTGCPWEPKHRLVKVGVFGRELDPKERPKSNLVFLVDVSGSMNSAEKLPLVVHGLQQLAKQLGENDRVAIVVYASSEGLVLPSTPGTEKETILGALGNLNAGGSTAGGAGITLAYQIALENFIEGGTNRVILCTDGDFNVGVTSEAELERMVEQKAKETKVFLSVIGFGRGNLNDSMMEKITGIGNGNYYYVDSQREAQRVFVKGMTGMLVTIAKDVKIQIEFNPNKVAGYRLLGYENRMLRTEDFNDDTKDAGEIGAGHRVTALYEIVPAGEPVTVAEADDFKYQRPPGLTPEAETEEMLTLKMRFKAPDGDTSQKLEWTATDPGKEYRQATADTQFATAVAGFGMLLRDSQYKGNLTFDAIHELASAALGSDPDGERSEFLTLVEAAKRLKGEIDAAKKAEEEAAKATPQPSDEPNPSTDPRVQDATPVAPK